jgi:PTH1 family peptidyl-tRNA hydrolase
MRNIKWIDLGEILGLKPKETEPPSMVIVGLGNPGPEYAQTRHNVGFWCIDRLAETYSITFSRRQRLVLVGEGTIDGQRVVLAKPRTFMNRSGQAVDYLLARFRIKAGNLLVVYDDKDLPPGAIRLRPRGSGGAHNGIQSVLEAAGTQDVPRLRIGIGQPSEEIDQVEYVLSAMPEDEHELVDEAVGRAADAVVLMLSDGIDEAMNTYNQNPKSGS